MTETNHDNYIKVLKIKGANGEERRLQFPMKLDLERPKRPRTTFTEDQLAILEEAFRSSGYLTGDARAKLAERLQLSDTQVKVWFQNRRTKNRRKPSPESEKPSEPKKTATSPVTTNSLPYPIFQAQPDLNLNFYSMMPFNQYYYNNCV